MKKEKLRLETLEVQSFITSAHENAGTIKGGVTLGCGNTFDYCNSVPVNNCNVGSYNAACPTVPVAECNVASANRILCDLLTGACIQSEASCNTCTVTTTINIQIQG